MFLSRDADFRVGESLRLYVACRVYSRKGGLLGRSYVRDEVISSRDLALLQLHVFARRLSRISAEVTISRSGGTSGPGRRVPAFLGATGAGFSSVGRNLVDSLSRGGQNTEWLFAAGHCAGSYESGEDLPIGCRDDAVEN